MEKQIQREIRKKAKEKKTKRTATVFCALMVLFFAASFTIVNVSLENWTKMSLVNVLVDIFFLLFCLSFFLGLIFLSFWLFFIRKIKKIPKIYMAKIYETRRNLSQEEKEIAIIKTNGGKIICLSLSEYAAEEDKYKQKPLGRPTYPFYRPGRVNFEIRCGEENFSVLCDVYLKEVPLDFLVRFFENRDLKLREELKLIIEKYFNNKLEKSSGGIFQNNLSGLMDYLEKNFRDNKSIFLFSGKGIKIGFLIQPIRVKEEGIIVWSKERARFVGAEILRKPRDIYDGPRKKEERKKEASSFIIE